MAGAASLISAFGVLTPGLVEHAPSVDRRGGQRRRGATALRISRSSPTSFLGAVSDRDPGDQTPTLVIDVGGGSTELILGAGGTVEFFVSMQGRRCAPQ
jgi:hypothetical protein